VDSDHNESHFFPFELFLGIKDISVALKQNLLKSDFLKISSAWPIDQCASLLLNLLFAVTGNGND
jgi:hypothetical protein